MKSRQNVLGLALPWLILLITVVAPGAALAEEQDGYVHHASGGLRVGWASADKTIVLIDEPHLLRAALDTLRATRTFTFGIHGADLRL